METSQRFLFAAVHQGPYLSIQPLENKFGPNNVSYLVEGVAKRERAQRDLPHFSLSDVQHDFGSLEGFLAAKRVKAIIRSSSEDVQENNVEEIAAVAGRNLDIPVFVVEDFPGNYWPGPGQRLDGLFVEDESLAAVHQLRGVSPQLIHGTGNPRYLELASVDTPALREETRQGLSLTNERVMLWAGQPDGYNSYRALRRLLRDCDSLDATLLFRAHPRDDSYSAGKYQSIFTKTSLKVLDVTTHPDVIALSCASDLVVTQFSSVAVEASYLGIPALFVLFEDLGKEYLKSAKGYDILPWCDGFCSFLIEHEEHLRDVLGQALFDDHYRAEVRANFRNRFGGNRDSAKAIADRVLAAVNPSGADNTPRSKLEPALF